MKESYYSKIILFGEYSMIYDANAMVIPLKRFSAKWTQAADIQDDFLTFSNRELSRFCCFLAADELLAEAIDTTSLADDLSNGCALISDVPLGYGLGSSGTVVAAVYDRYSKEKTTDALILKKRFARMESFFHGSSSGIDPLQCYLGKPFMINEKGITILPDDFPQMDIHICLIDTKTKSDTKPLVMSFMKQRKDPEFLRTFRQEYLPAVSSCMDTLIQDDPEGFFQNLGLLTAAQLRFFRKMIPESVFSLFENNYDFRFGIKILGSGGGGYMLGFTDDIGRTAAALTGYDVLWL